MNLGDRMKRYEQAAWGRLMRRTPAILRVDGKAFHSLTRGMEKPWDQMFQQCMWDTAISLCQHVQGARLAYCQSDEISVLLIDYQSLTSEAWFDYEIQKCASVGAATATAAFGRAFRESFPDRTATPLFDARLFSVPREDVTNYFLWRQRDAERNSISGLAQAHFSHKQLHGLSTDQMQDLLWKEKQINWNDCPAAQKRGACVLRVPKAENRSAWEVDPEPPIFSQEREYVERFVVADV